MPRGLLVPVDRAALAADDAGRRAERRGDQTYETAVGVIARRPTGEGRDSRRSAAEAEEVFARLAKLYPRSNAGVTTNVVTGGGGLDRRRLARVINTMFAAVVLVLLIACANVASLDLRARRIMRVYEAGMRVALGARAVRGWSMQMLGGKHDRQLRSACWVGLCWRPVALHLTGHRDPQARRRIHDAAVVDVLDRRHALRCLLRGIAVLAAVLAGILPALRASRPDVMRVSP